MSVFGIVSEFNPFHLGHEYLISCAKEMGAQAVVCVMSGNSTQRGELSVIDKYLRAEAAVDGGADLVLELPFPWSSSSAEGFALAAIHILSSFCDTVIFGSECGDIELLSQIAEFVLTEGFKKKFSELLENGKQSAVAYTSLIEEKFATKLSSNDLLGIEYIKAAKVQGLSIGFITVKRQGSAYLSSEKSNDGFDSAMAIRKMLLSDVNVDELKNRLPEKSFELLKMAKKNGEILNEAKYGECVMMYFRLFNNTTNDSFAESDGGILERICNSAHESSNYNEFWQSLSTKRYTDAKLRRAVLFAMCGVRKNDIKSFPVYTLLLGADARGRELLSICRRAGRLAVVTKPADVSCVFGEDAKRQSALEYRLASIYNHCLEAPAPTGQSMKKRPYIT